MNSSTILFHDRYSLARLIERTSEYELWEARDTFGGPVLVKAWPFGHERPADEERALWNADLRHLFRLASLPESEHHLVVLKDAGIDWNHKCFAMVMIAPGLALLETALADPSRYGWLRNRKEPAVRADLWRGVRRLALGILQLHGQQMFHRAISATSVLVDPERGPASFRLGGFEWTVRLGEEIQIGSAVAPLVAGTYSFESDWFMFGLLTARVVAAINLGLEETDEAPKRVDELQYLTGEEKELIHAVLAQERNARLSQGDEIVRRIDSIIAELDEPRKLNSEDYLGLIVLLGPQRPLTLAIIEIDETISALEFEAQRKFIEEDLQRPRIVRNDGANRETYTLVGNRLRYIVTEHLRDETAMRGSWGLAYSGQPTELRYSSGEDDQAELKRVPIRVFTLRALANDESVVRKAAVPWKSFLPRSVSSVLERDSLQRLHDFFRITNQIELLMRDAEIFAYTILERGFVDGAEEVHLREVPRQRPALQFAHFVGGLAEFLQREEEARDGNLVYLGDEEGLELGRDAPPAEFWYVTDVNTDSGVITLRRPERQGQQPPPSRGYLRARGLFGQMSLIKRRKRAIDRLGSHAYLLRALQTPDFTFVDTGEALPRIIDPSQIDAAKRAAMQSIWRTRPIFALQGPPGTGKTTLVASLLSQVFDDDPLAQVLVTAQAHAAVDVLREKVRQEVGHMSNPPLAIRLQRAKGDTTLDPDYAEQVAKTVLARSVAQLAEVPERTPIQSRWLEMAQDVMRSLSKGDTTRHAGDFCELIKRAAGITYCTTTSANLEALADTTQTFDWSIVEEAGKAHGFDLALPLRAGHRWLLIGDQKQLWPYRYEDFRNGLMRLDETFDALDALPKRGGGQVDQDLMLRWKKYDSTERSSRRQFWLRWLPFFETVHATCSRVKLPAEEGLALPESGGPVLAAMLSRQHRMHPVIAGLVSAAYYGEGIKSETVESDGSPSPRVVHAFAQPPQLMGRAILWLDVPWVGAVGGEEIAPEDFGGRYTSDYEVKTVLALLSTLKSVSPDKMDLAVLSPYRKQVARLQNRLHQATLPDWLKHSSASQERYGRRIAATVDSFQGNQADVVIVSLVRNNTRSDGQGLGFLRESRRMNVLFSRAERLLVLVGSWEFLQQQLVGIPADDSQPLGHWKLAMDYLESCFATGSALKLPARTLWENK